MAQLLPLPKIRFVDANGLALVGGKLWSYQAGTSTPLATYVDQTETTPNTNPVILDANGEADVWISSNSYKLVLEDANGVQLWSEDNIASVNNGSITALKLASDSVTTVKILDGNVTAAKLASNSVTTVKILDGNVTAAKLADGAVTTVKILDANVTTAKLAAGAVTRTKMLTLGSALSSSSGTFTTSSTSYVDVTNLTVTITTTGGAVLLGLVPDPAGGSAINYATSGGVPGIQCLRGVTVIGGCQFTYPTVPTSSFQFYDAPAAGTYTYKIQASGDSLFSGALDVRYVKLFARELI